MLSSLIIENYAIIDKQEILFKKGFSVITGETGAGKSIMLGALGLVLGQRADTKTIREGANKCIIEACFEISEYNLRDFFAEKELDYDNNCIIRREVLSSGKSRSFVNDTPVALSDLKELGIQLIDIHSQHENLLLNDKNFQLNVLDIIAKTSNELISYQKKFSEFSTIQNELSKLTDLATSSSSEKEYLQFQFDQLSATNLQAEEKESLEKELKKLSHSEELKIELSKLQQLLSDDTNGIVLNLKEAINTLGKVSNYFSKSDEINDRLNTSFIDLKDLSSDIEILQSDVEFNPERLEYINQRLDTIYTLEQKHKLSGTEALISYQKEIESQLLRIDSFDEEINKLKTKLIIKSQELALSSKKLTAKRTTGSKEMSKKIIPQLLSLGIKNVQFQVLISEKQEFSSNGKDQIDFMFSANEKTSMQAVSKIASGGEISRLMLSIKSLIAEKKELPCIVFDEIDNGISGEIADKMADIMCKMSTKTQVICITHLPQIGAKGKMHYKVFKQSSTTQIKQLDKTERINEIALMLSGSTVSDAAIQNAKALLAN